MNKLIQRLSGVADSLHYCLLRSESRAASRNRRSNSFRIARDSRSGVPQGHVPVYVGDEMERFVVGAELLHHPIFVELLKRSAQEYGYEQKGVLRIPCCVLVFERVLEALKVGDETRDLEELLPSFSSDFL